jgi:hypothetical protein
MYVLFARVHYSRKFAPEQLVDTHLWAVLVGIVAQLPTPKTRVWRYVQNTPSRRESEAISGWRLRCVLGVCTEPYLDV